MFTLAANDFPPDPIVISAIIRVDQETVNRMRTERLKKILPTWPRSKPPPGSIRLFVEGM